MKSKYTSLVFGVKIFSLSNYAGLTRHFPLVVNVCVMGHVMCGFICIKDLAVHEIDTANSDLYFAHSGMIPDPAFLMCDIPVGYALG